MKSMSSVRMFAALAGALALAACGSESGLTRESIRAVGSSTVFPFAKAASESFARTYPQFGSPIIEGTGTGAGINLFCAGIGAHTPDMVNASRRMHQDEFANCQANGVSEIVEIPIGFDGLVLASAIGGISMNLTTEMVYRAFAAEPYGQPQTARTWRDVDASLPDLPILIYGPPSTSGTRDSFEELVLAHGCDSDPQMAALAETDRERHRSICTRVRTDGAYVDMGEQDNLIVQRIRGNPNGVGIFGFSFLEENSDVVRGLPLNGSLPTYQTISSDEYPGARAMYVYVKRQHLDAIPGLRELAAHWVEVMDQGGPLAGIGLITNDAQRMEQARVAATQFHTMNAADLQR